jgi:hypothetical protein
MNFEEIGWEGVDWINVARLGQVASSGEYGTEPAGVIKM